MKAILLCLMLSGCACAEETVEMRILDALYDLDSPGMRQAVEDAKPGVPR